MSISVIGSRSSFGSYLRELRKRKGIESPVELARLMSKHGNKISVSAILKRERGEHKISQDYVDAFIEAVRASAEEKKHLYQHLDLFRLQFDVWRAGESVLDILTNATARLEEAAHIQCFCPTVIPHVLQTRAYGRAIMETSRWCANETALEKALDLRQKSAERIRRESHRSVQLINSEGALYAIYGGPEVMIEQLLQLLRMDDDYLVQYRLIPLGMHSNLPMDSTFTIHDGLFVTAENTIGNVYTGDKNMGAWAVGQFERLWSVAVSGKQRQAIIQRAIHYMQENCGLLRRSFSSALQSQSL